MGLPRIFSYLSNQGTSKEDLGDFVLACLALYTKTLFQQFPSVVSAISLLPQRIPFLILTWRKRTAMTTWWLKNGYFPPKISQNEKKRSRYIMYGLILGIVWLIFWLGWLPYFLFCHFNLNKPDLQIRNKFACDFL